MTNFSLKNVPDDSFCGIPLDSLDAAIGNAFGAPASEDHVQISVVETQSNVVMKSGTVLPTTQHGELSDSEVQKMFDVLLGRSHA